MAKTKVKEVIKEETVTQAKETKVDRCTEVRVLIMDAKNKIGAGYIDMALLACEADKDELYKKWGYDRFKDYAEKELDIKYRKLMYFVEIGKKCIEMKLPKERLEQLGWSKLSLMCSVLNEENINEWLEKSETMSTRELGEAVQIYKKTDPTFKAPKVVTIKFRLEETVATTVMNALDIAMKLTENDNQSIALEMICSDWLETQSAVPTLTPLEAKVAYLEKIYGVKLEIKEKIESKEVAENTEVESEDDLFNGLLKEVDSDTEKTNEKVEKNIDTDTDDLLDLLN